MTNFGENYMRPAVGPHNQTYQQRIVQAKDYEEQNLDRRGADYLNNVGAIGVGNSATVPTLSTTGQPGSDPTIVNCVGVPSGGIMISNNDTNEPNRNLYTGQYMYNIPAE